MRAPSLGWQEERQTVVAGEVVHVLAVEASSDSITKMLGCLLCLLVAEASKRKTVVAGGVVCHLAVEVGDGGIPVIGECTAQAEADQASSGGTIKMTQSLLQPMVSKSSGSIGSGVPSLLPG